MKAIIYARVSSVDEKQSFSRQLVDLEKYANYKGLEVVESFAEKISGFRKGLDDRIEFNKMLVFIEKENIKNILVSELSRISRRYIDTINFINDCSLKGVNIHILKEGISTLNDDGSTNSMVQMLIGMLSSVAQQESESLSYRIKSGKNYQASLGKNFNKKIYGYDSDDGLPVINKEKAILVRKMFELILKGIGTKSVANYLNTNYITKHWTAGSVHSIITNSFFCGKRKYLKTIIKVPHIVSVEDFDNAQVLMKHRKRFVGKSKSVNPFASFINCECGATFSQVVVKEGKLDIYRCAKKCGIKSVNRQFLISEVRQA